MIFITGDTHGNFNRIAFFCRIHKTSTEDTMIILGDAGINYYGGKKDKFLKEQLSSLPITFFCIRGNHEKNPEKINSYKTKEWNEGIVFYEEEYPNILFAKDGEIYKLNEKKTMVIGGAYSVDKYYRLSRGWNWFEDEQPSEKTKKEVEANLEKNDWTIDVFLTHTCPTETVPVHLFLPGIDQSTVDTSTEEWLQTITERTIFKKWYFGHYHGIWENDKYQLMFENIEEFEV